VFDFSRARIVLVGPMPPPPGGMANQTEQLARLLRSEGAVVDVVPTNAPYRPAFVNHLRGLRAAFRLLPYTASLRRAARRATLFHVMANSGWSWHLFAAPALRAARRHRVPSVLNYRGGEAESFFSTSFGRVEGALRRASVVAVPSSFLAGVFERFGVDTDIVPNIVDLERFHPAALHENGNGAGPRVLIARHLESIYDVGTGIRAFGLLRERFPGAVLDIAGAGPEAGKLESLTAELGVEGSVRFLGRVPNEDMPALYRASDLALNTSLVDNMPISILEALASGVPVVSTRVGGVPALVEDGKEAALVAPRDPVEMAGALVRLWSDPKQRESLREAGLKRARSYGWESVREQWGRVYEKAVTPERQSG
jgi:L-malate glycosyltransferase